MLRVTKAPIWFKNILNKQRFITKFFVVNKFPFSTKDSLKDDKLIHKILDEENEDKSQTTNKDSQFKSEQDTNLGSQMKEDSNLNEGSNPNSQVNTKQEGLETSGSDTPSNSN